MKIVKNNKIREKGKSVVLFATPSCNPCKNMKQIIEQLEENHSDKANFYYVNTLDNEILSKKYNIKSVPTTIFQNDDTVKDRFAGFIETIDLENKLMNLLFDFGSEIDEFNDFDF